MFGVKWDPAKTAAEEESNKIFVAFPTAAQRKALKKEVAKLEAWKQLVSYSMPDLIDTDSDNNNNNNNEEEEKEEDNVNENDDIDKNDSSLLFPVEILESIWNSFLSKETEVIQIRGLSRQNPKYVYATAEQLCRELEEYQGSLFYNNNNNNNIEEGVFFVKEVTLLSTKGHSAILYCPILELNHPKKIVLMTSVGQKNAWKPRVKPPRDSRGQIIPEELRREDNDDNDNDDEDEDDDDE